jgi:2-polyprenyl-3-methyl-5-hydroxy-6-metoxy-1,4-benzoquinol methylase
LVDTVMRLVTAGGAHALESPHLHGGSDRDRVLWEYDAADEFWMAFEEFVGLDVLDGMEVLDVGCGWGGKAINYAERSGLRSIAGFDIPGVFRPDVPKALAAERGLENCEFVTGLAEQIPFGDERFDVAIVDDVLEHVQNPPRVLDECRRVLRPGGTLLIKFPSIRMLSAHHLDRAVDYPGLHYLLPIRTWASGLNHYLLQNRNGMQFEPFDEVVETAYHPAITRNLNGLDFRAFRALAQERFRIRMLKVVRMPDLGPPANWRGRAFSAIHSALWARVPRLREVLGWMIAFIGERPAG